MAHHIHTEEEPVYLDQLVLENCASLIKYKKFAERLSLELVSHNFATLITLNPSNLNVSLKIIVCSQDSFNLYFMSRQWGTVLTPLEMQRSKLGDIFVHIFLRFKRFRLISFEGARRCSAANIDINPEILSNVILEERCRPIRVEELKIVYMELVVRPICSLLVSLSSLLKTLRLEGQHVPLQDQELGQQACSDLCKIISTLSALKRLVFDGYDDYQFAIVAPLGECLKDLKHLKHFQYTNKCVNGINANWLSNAFSDNTNLRTLRLNNLSGFDPACFCDSDMRPFLSRLRFLAIDGNHFTDILNITKKNELRQILTSLYESGQIKIVIKLANSDDWYWKVSDVFKAWVELSNFAARPILLHYDIHVYYDIAYAKMMRETESAISVLSLVNVFEGLAVERHQSKNLTVLRYRNAKVTIVMQIGNE